MNKIIPEKFGGLWINLLGIEIFMRLFISKKKNEETKFQNLFQSGNTEEIENPPSSFLCKYFGDLVKEFNNLIPDEQQKIKPWLEELRNSLAHGIVWSKNPDMDPLEFYKFKIHKNKKLFLETSFEMKPSPRTYGRGIWLITSSACPKIFLSPDLSEVKSP